MKYSEVNNNYKDRLDKVLEKNQVFWAFSREQLEKGFKETKTMKKTEKKHWVNGHQVRGGWFHTLNLSLGNQGLMVYWGKGRVEIERYQLI